MVILFRHKALLTVSALLFASLLVHGISSGGMVLRMMDEATAGDLEAEASDQAALVTRLTDDLKADLTILGAHRDVENYFTYRAFEELDGMTESLANLELFFRQVFKVKPYYDRMQIALPDGTAVLQIDHGVAVERFALLDPDQTFGPQVQAKGEAILFTRPLPDGSVSLAAAAPLRAGGETEGVLFLTRPLAPLVASIVGHLRERNLAGGIVDRQGKVVATTAEGGALPFMQGADDQWISVDHPLPPLPWVLRIGAPRSENFALFRNLLVANVVAAGLLVGVVFWVVRKAFDALRRYNQILQKKVEERTAALEEANRELERIASTDSLTGIANRRRFLEVANREYERVKRHPAPLTLIQLDVDHFKKVNDTYGHAAGDAVLKELALQIGALLRQPDLFGRLGGEEFAILLPDTDREGAKRLAERLRARVEGTKVPYGGIEIPLTASFGVTDVVTCDRGIECSLQRGDEALYEAKGQGRNRVISYFGPEEPVATPGAERA